MSFDKVSTSLLQFYDSYLQWTMQINGVGLCNGNQFFLNICASLKVLELTGSWKSLQQKDRRRAFQMIFFIFESTATAVSECNFV